MKQFLLLLILTLPLSFYAQNISGVVYDGETNQPFVGVRVVISEGGSTFTDEKGEFNFEVTTFPITLTIEEEGFESYSQTFASSNTSISLLLKPAKSQSLENIVVTASRRGQKIEDVPISMDILKPTLIANKGVTTADQAVEQSPGVYSMDGQIAIRGGSGFSYGAGSRVMVLWNDIPMLSADAGDIKWNTVPIELSSGIEVIKGASSVLYGSGALNGIIAIRETMPTTKPYYKARVQFGIYDQPKRLGLRSDKVLMNQLAEFSHGQRKGNFFYNIGLSVLNDDGFREGEVRRQGRITGSVGYNIPQVRGLQVGLGYSVHFQHQGNFLIWESDSLAYTPMGGADVTDSASTLSVMNGWRIMVDPYIKYVGKDGLKHALKGRIYSTMNDNLTNKSQNSIGNSYYVDYLLQKDFGNKFNISSGVTYLRTEVMSNLFGNHHSDNVALYAQIDKSWGRFSVTGGARFEYFKHDNTPIDSYLYLKKDSSAKIPLYPVLRAAVTYKATKSTILRASFGQGLRYPATSERFVAISVGALNIFPNADLKREEGYSGELGVKQVFMIGDGWKGMLDASGFINYYKNMTEFTFGIYNPDSVQLTAQNVSDWIGFRAENAEQARILGAELTFASEGKIGEVTLRTLLGYTYMNPKSLNNDSTYLTTSSDTVGRLLKYRFEHLAKADFEVEYKKFSIGFSARYNSHMRNIDKIFEVAILPDLYILEGLKEYREKHNKGYVVMDARIGYEINSNFRVGFIVNNFLNTEYMGRPGDVRAPRSFMAQLQLNF